MHVCGGPGPGGQRRRHPGGQQLLGPEEASIRRRFPRRHQPIVTGSGLHAAQHPTFKSVNTVFGNVKSAMRGSLHVDAVSAIHVPRYLVKASVYRLLNAN